jgi:hypothetical protein
MKPAGEAIKVGKELNRTFIAQEKNLYAQLFGGFDPQGTKTVDLSSPVEKGLNLMSGLVFPGVSAQQDANQAQVEGQYAMDNNNFGVADHLSAFLTGQEYKPGTSAYTDEYQTRTGIIPKVVTDIFKQLSGSK